MAADMDDDVGAEDLTDVVVERQVLVVRRDDRRTVERVDVGLPPALRLRPQENVAVLRPGESRFCVHRR
jgi:hypothetical protein